jgi:starch-binding outer membrane protein, SusD/RagB family
MNLKISKLLLVAPIAMLSLGSCKKSFLNDPKPGSSVASTDVFASEDGARSYFNGIYRRMRIQYGTSTDAWGIASVNLAREAKGLDIVLPDGASAWYGFDYTHDNREPNFRRTRFTWSFFYDFINQANIMIDGVSKSTSIPETVKPRLLGEARAMRAWCYFELVREFSHAYSENPDGKGVPIYDVPTSAATQGKPRAKLSENYAMMLDDLKYAVANLGTTRPLKDVINKDVANGLLARVYLEMKDWANAKTAAQAAKANYPLTPSEYQPMTDIAKKEVIWGFPQQSDQTIFYGTPSAHYGYTGLVYNGFFIDSNFVNTFTATDIRKATFVNTGLTSTKKWVTKKFGTTTNFADHIIMMRTAEMWLIEAEAKARLGESDAATILYTLQKNRDPNAIASGNTGGADLMAEILYERRKELYGEIGISFMDIKRLGLPLVRSTGHPTLYRFNFAANENRFTLKIPQEEFDANKSLTAADQNP